LALNLRDSGASLIVGNLDDAYAERARADGFVVRDIAQACKAADIALVLLPDEVIPEAFAEKIAPCLRPGAAIGFASGYCLAYGLAAVPQGIDALLLAPRMGGEAIRQRFVNGEGFHAFLSVEHDRSGQAWKRLLGLADAVGALRTGSFELDARREANLDLFIEQTLGAAIGAAVLSAFSVGVDNGLPAEALALEMYMSGEMETVWNGFRTEGFHRSAATHGPTAMFGGMLRTMELFQTGLLEQFQKTCEEIQSGQFAGRFQEERAAGYPMLNKVRAMYRHLDPLGEAEEQVRERLRE
jgi:ketol-acid reductoisomerase